jgi:hypothetical protein
MVSTAWAWTLQWHLPRSCQVASRRAPETFGQQRLRGPMLRQTHGLLPIKGRMTHASWHHTCANRSKLRPRAVLTSSLHPVRDRARRYRLLPALLSHRTPALAVQGVQLALTPSGAHLEGSTARLSFLRLESQLVEQATRCPAPYLRMAHKALVQVRVKWDVPYHQWAVLTDPVRVQAQRQLPRAPTSLLILLLVLPWQHQQTAARCPPSLRPADTSLLVSKTHRCLSGRLQIAPRRGNEILVDRCGRTRALTLGTLPWVQDLVTVLTPSDHPQMV